MKDIFLAIELRVERLKNSNFCNWLKTSHLTEDYFSFLPSQAFLVFGFRDILQTLKVENPKDPLEHLINQHCEEDSDHWKWYLQDLKMLGFDTESWGPSFTNMIEGLWTEDQFKLRQLIYASMYYIRKGNSPLTSLIVVEILEGAFEAFIEGMRHPVEKFGLYKSLQYYGKTHTEKEESHSLWDGPEALLLQADISASQKELCLEAVDELFNLFEDSFQLWYSHRQTYSRKLQPKDLSPEPRLQGETWKEVLA